MELNSLLVPVDFSAASESAYREALAFAAGDGPLVVLLHVIDPSLVEFAEVHGLGSREEVTQRMRQRALEQLELYKQQAPPGVEVDILVSEGIPFLEILKKADDFQVDAIVIGKVGTRGTIEKLLFGSTAEKVLRGSFRPVIVLPLAVA